MNLPAAAAGSEGLLTPPAAGLKGVFEARGLRLRLASEVFAEGDLDLRSKRERLTSGSVWSNRERFELLRSSSAIFSDLTKTCKNVPECLGVSGV